MFGKRYLSETHLNGFDRYKYNSIDTSVLSVYVMHPFWNKCVLLFPKWIAPNLITFTGFLLTVVNFILIGYYDFDFTMANGEKNLIPRWVWLVAAINIFMAYTLDGIDGKQARRTGTSGPLGELFDHGLDSYSAVLIPLYMFSLFGTNDLSPLRMHFVIWNVFLNFYLTHFEKYNTGVMFLPWAYDFTMWGVTITLLITSIVGAEIWTTTLPIIGAKPARTFEYLLYISGVLTSHPIIFKNIVMSYRNKTGKMRPFLEAMRPLYPFGGLFIITTVWVMFSNNQILSYEPRLMFALFGTVFSNICCRLIVAQMSDTRTDGWNWLMYLVALCTIVSVVPYEKFGLPSISLDAEQWIVYGSYAFATVFHIHYGSGVVREMCRHFKINCFTVRSKHYETINNNNINHHSNNNINKIK